MEDLALNMYWNIFSIVFRPDFSPLKQKSKPPIALAVCLVFQFSDTIKGSTAPSFHYIHAAFCVSQEGDWKSVAGIVALSLGPNTLLVISPFFIIESSIMETCDSI